MKLDIQKIDVESLDELIAACEDKMISPFRKKKKEPEALEPEAEIADTEEEAPASPDLSDMDLEELLEAYREMKSED